jgi:Na+/H+-dicarboxylate symporter
VLGIVAQVVGRSGLEVFRVLWLFLVVILAGLLIHSLVYYPLMAWLVGRKSPREYLGGGSDAVLTGLSTNSSLATVPVTLRCLRDMKVGEASARVSACIGTNLNNDGIILYEAMATVFICQAFGYNLSFAHQVTIVLASVMAGVGIAGVPEAGLIVLPLVLAAAGLPEAAVAAAIPLIVPVDWIIARVRSGVNVLADMLVAILLDRFDRSSGRAGGASSLPSHREHESSARGTLRAPWPSTSRPFASCSPLLARPTCPRASPKSRSSGAPTWARARS